MVAFGCLKTPPTLEPCLAELLRTCVHPPLLVLRVEHVFGKAHPRSPGNAVDSRQTVEATEEPNEDGGNGGSDNELTVAGSADSAVLGNGSINHVRSNSTCPRFALSDGRLQVQAVLAAHLHTLEEVSHLQPGDVIEVKNFEVRRAPRLNGEGSVIYLGIQDCRKVTKSHKIIPAEEDEEEAELEEGGFLREEEDEMAPKRPIRTEEQALKNEFRSWSKRPDRKPKQGEGSRSTSLAKKAKDLQESDSDDEAGFDTLDISQSQVENRRDVLRKIQEPTTAEGKSTENLADVENHVRLDGTPENPGAKLLDAPLAVPREDGLTPQLQPQILPPMTTAISKPTTAPQDLISLIAATFQKSYSCPPIFGIVSWVSTSLIHRPNSPYGPKRHVKIHDPSVSDRRSGITVAVFVDAARFLPPVGTVALLKGLVMNRASFGGDEVILNRYAVRTVSQKMRDGESQATGGGDSEEIGEEDWFISDEEKLMKMGYDVQGMKKWWAERATSSKDGAK